MEFWQFYRILRKRLWLILLGVVVCVGLVVIANALSTQRYTGHTELMEANGLSNSSVPLFPEAVYQLDVQLRLSNLGKIATSQQVVRNASNTLRDLGIQMSPVDIITSTTVQPVKDTNILAVEVTLASPEDAKITADTIANEFRKFYSDINSSAMRKSREFIASQLITTRKAMIKSEAALRDFKQQNGIVVPEQQRLGAEQRLAQAKVDFNSATANYEAARAQTANLESELNSMPEWQVTGSQKSSQISRDPTYQRLKDQLVQLETQKASLLNGKPGEPRKGPKHPDVLSVQRQIDDIHSQLVDKTKQDYLASSTTVKTEARNQVYDLTKQNWVQSKADEFGKDAQRQALQAVIEQTRQEMSVMPAQQAKLAELETDVQAAGETYRLMRTKLDEATIKEKQTENESALRVIEPAYVTPVDKKFALKTILAFILSLLLGVGVALMLEYIDTGVKNAAQLKGLIDIPVLAEIPLSKYNLLVKQNCSEAVETAVKMLSANCWIAGKKQEVRSIVIVGAQSNSGKSTNAANLAVSLAKEGARVVLVDADIRKPVLHQMMGVDNKVGLTNLLSGAATLEDVLIPTKIQGLLLVPSGPVPSNPVKLLRSPEMQDFVSQISEVADFVIYDTAAGMLYPDSALIAAYAGTAIVSVSTGKSAIAKEKDLLARLNGLDVHIIGAVLNKVKKEDISENTQAITLTNPKTADIS